MVEKGFREGICRTYYRYAQANNKYKSNHHILSIET